MKKATFALECGQNERKCECARTPIYTNAHIKMDQNHHQNEHFENYFYS